MDAQDEFMAAENADTWEARLDVAEADLLERERAALGTEVTAHELLARAAERDKLSDARDQLATVYDERATQRDLVSLDRDVRATDRDRDARLRFDNEDGGVAGRFLSSIAGDEASGDRADSNDDRARSAVARSRAAEERDRASAERHRAAERLDSLERELATLRAALHTRNLIGQAQGLLIERYGTDSEGAFRMLVRLSQQMHVKLRDVAARLVADAVGESSHAE